MASGPGAGVRYFCFCAHEQFPPRELLRQAVAAEQAGFDGIGCSDHLQPWWEPGESGHAWVWLGAAAPPVGRKIERMEEALELIPRLFEGERVTHEGQHFRTKQAYLHTRPPRRPPIYVSAFGPK